MIITSRLRKKDPDGSTKKVLDRGAIELRESMGGDYSVVEAARICTQIESHSEEADRKLIEHCMSADPVHNTVFEHVVMTWYVKCPLFVARQWLRHRIGSFCEKSLRFCAADREFFLPGVPPEVVDKVICSPTDLASYCEEDLITQDQIGAALAMASAFDTYDWLVRIGWKPEQARIVIPVAIYTEFIWTVNAWSFMNWLYKRLDKAAQWEHRQYALAALAISHKIMPTTIEAFCRHQLSWSDGEISSLSQ